MEVFICGQCKTQHDYQNLTATIMCDGCKQPITNGSHACTTCKSWAFNYHKSCVTKLDGKYYCAVHATKKTKAMEAAAIIKKYATSFWNETGGKVGTFVTDKDTYYTRTKRHFKVVYPALTLEVEMLPLNKAGDDFDEEENLGEEVKSLRYLVRGIKKYGASKFEANIHSHTGALIDVISAVLRSLYSKKSSITFEQRNLTSTTPYLRAEKSRLKKHKNKINDTAKILKAKLAKLKEVKPAVEEVLVGQESI